MYSSLLASMMFLGGGRVLVPTRSISAALSNLFFNFSFFAFSFLICFLRSISSSCFLSLRSSSELRSSPLSSSSDPSDYNCWSCGSSPTLLPFLISSNVCFIFSILLSRWADLAYF